MHARRNDFLLMVVMAAWAMTTVSGCKSPVGDNPPVEQVVYSEIYAANADGTNPRQLTFGRNFIHYLNFIPNSNKIFFVQTGTDIDPVRKVEYRGTQHICTMDLLTGRIDTLVQADVYEASPKQLSSSYEDYPRSSIKCSSDGRRIYYVSKYIYSGNGKKGIFSVDVASKAVTTHLLSDRIKEFGLSPDESRIVFTEYDDKTFLYSLTIMDVDGGNKKILIPPNIHRTEYPQVLSDNNEIVCIQEPQDFRYQLNVIDVTTLHVTTVVKLSTYLNFYTELVKGDNIVVLPDTASTHLAFINLKTVQSSEFSVPYGEIPYFSQGGEKVLYFDKNSSLWSVNLDGTNHRLLLPRQANTGSFHVPQLSESKNMIVFIHADKFELF